jgi:hypothetical protein
MSQMGVSPIMVGNFPWDANLCGSLGSHEKILPTENNACAEIYEAIQV